jgi:hypothetical protein
MDARQDELDEASCQLMMDIQTGRILATPRPPRGRRFLGVGLVMLGGLAGLLVASGHLMSETPSAGKGAASPLIAPIAQSQPKELPDVTPSPTTQSDAPPATVSDKESLPTDPPQVSPRQAPPRVKKSALSPEAQGGVKPSRKRPTRLSKAARQCNCPLKDQPQAVARHRSFHISRPLAYEFDRNAEFVQSTP